MDDHEKQRLRTIPLESVMERFGAQRDPKDPKRNWKIGGSRITVDNPGQEKGLDQAFHDHNKAVGGGGAIDLTMHLMGYDFKAVPLPKGAFRAAAQWLGAIEQVVQAARMQEQRRVDPAALEATASKQEPPVPDASRLQRVRFYLTETRSIPAELVDATIRQGRVFADAKGNAVFRLFDAEGNEVGFEKRGTYDKPYHGVYGEKGLFAVGSRQARVAAFVESAIEALSYKALQPEALVISTTGNAIELPQKVAQGLLARGVEVVAAFNADKDGDRFAARFIERLGGAARRERPDELLGKDWNLVLRSERDRASRQRTDQAELTR